MILKRFSIVLAVAALTTLACSPTNSQEDFGHFDAKGKPPSEHTKAILEAAKADLPLSDTRDFEEYAKGFIAAPDSKIIEADAGHVAWDLERFNFLLEQDEFSSIHPSLVRQSQLNMNFGLYEVIPGIYQVRGFALANITFVRGKTGWIVFDPTEASESARAAKDLLDEHVEELPVVAVIYSHNHGDHWAGVRGIVDQADVLSGKVQIIAPRAFMQNAISEQVFAGNAMNRRMYYQYGVLLPANPYGYVGQGLSQSTAAGHTGLIAPTHVVEDDIRRTHCRRRQDGVSEYAEHRGAVRNEHLAAGFKGLLGG